MQSPRVAVNHPLSIPIKQRAQNTSYHTWGVACKTMCLDSIVHALRKLHFTPSPSIVHDFSLNIIVCQMLEQRGRPAGYALAGVIRKGNRVFVGDAATLRLNAAIIATSDPGRAARIIKMHTYRGGRSVIPSERQWTRSLSAVRDATSELWGQDLW